MNTTLFNRITPFADTHNLLPEKATLIVGLSGGPDSVFLLHYLAYLRAQRSFTLVAAHLDHGWRTDSSDDVQFCQELCKNLDVQLVIAHARDLGVSLQRHGSQEALGRSLRRSFFETVRQNHQATAIALAHHADDQQETFFIRLMRGASLTGLTGIQPRNGHYIRPLLTIAKADILAWLAHHKIAYCNDSTNTAPTYLRNRIRTDALPALRRCDTRFDNTFARTLEQLQTTEDFLHTLTLTTLHDMTVPQSSACIRRTPYLQLHSLMQQRVLLQWLIASKVKHTPTQSFFAEILRFIRQPGNGAHVIAPGWQLEKRGDVLSLQPTAMTPFAPFD